MGRQTPGERSLIPSLQPQGAYNRQDTPGHRSWEELGRAGRVPQNVAQGPGIPAPPFLLWLQDFRRARPWEGEAGRGSSWSLASAFSLCLLQAQGPRGEEGVVPGQLRQDQESQTRGQGCNHTSRNGRNGKALCGVISAPSAGRQLESELRGGQWLTVEEGEGNQDGRCELGTRSGRAGTCSKQLATATGRSYPTTLTWGLAAPPTPMPHSEELSAPLALPSSLQLGAAPLPWSYGYTPAAGPSVAPA